MGHVKSILSLDRDTLSVVVQMITGHNFLRRQNFVVGDDEDSECRLCLEDEESSFHVIAECPALGNARLTVFGTHHLEQPLKWSSQMLTFLRGRSIGRLLDLGAQESADFVGGASVAGEED